MDETFEAQKEQIKNDAVKDNAIIIANILELTSSVVGKLASKDFEGALNGDSVTKSVLANIGANRIKEHALKTLRGVAHADA